MKVTLQQIVNPVTIKAIEVLASESFVPKNVIWPLAKSMAKIGEETKTWTTARTAILNKYGEEKGKGVFDIPTDQVDQANEELKALLATEIDLPLSEPIKLPTPMPDSTKLTAMNLVALVNAGLITE